MLTEIIVVDSDLDNIVPNIADYKFIGQADFSDQIAEARKDVYRMVYADMENNNPSYTHAKIKDEVEKVHDFIETPNLKDCIVRLAISRIFKGNSLLEMAGAYEMEASLIPLRYHYDVNEDNVIDTGEISVRSKYVFGR